MLLTISAVISVTLWAYACGDGTTDPPPYFPEPATVTVSPDTAELTALGATVQLSAEVRDQNGAVMAGATVTWASSDAGAATVNASGLVTAVSNGGATITATAGSASGSATVTVAQEVSAVVVTPDSATVLEGDTLRLAATAADANGQAVTGVELAWASGDTAVAVVDASGLVTGVATGQVQVTVTAAGLTGRAELAVVTPLPTTVAVTPDTVVLTAVGQTAQLTAEVRNQAGRVMEGVPVAWLSAETTVAAVDASGLVTAVGVGAVTITATAGEASGDALVTVAINPDRAALVALYEATGGPNWLNNANWLTDAPLGTWYGVDTNAAGQVVRLVLRGYIVRPRVHQSHGLTGTLPPELGYLTHLEELDLAYNNLTGVIPPELGQLSSLRHLRLTYNSFTGPIPSELGALVNLKSLNLYRSSLTGSIPPEMAELVNLEELHLGNNNLTGLIPSWLGDTKQLRELNLIQNDFEGPIPRELGNLADLRELNLYGNGLSGVIPPELGKLTNLRQLLLHYNDLTGPIPPELGNLAAMTEMILSNNHLTGSVPPELGNLASLRSLWLEGNDLTGSVPPELGALSQLEALALSGNQLTGSIPSTFEGLQNLLSLGCQSTLGLCVPATDEFREWVREMRARGRFARPVDVTFCDEIDRQALESFYEATDGPNWTRSDGWLEDRDLGQWHGVQTDSIGRISALDLSSNGLSGQVPEAVRLLSGMTQLRLQDNALAGQLPRSLADLRLEEFDYGDTSLCVRDDPEFQKWLNGIPLHTGTGVQCPPLTEREILEHLYRNAEGPNWAGKAGWLSNAPLTQWHGVDTDANGRVIALSLDGNHLRGSIPVELAELRELRSLNLERNALSGPIPPELTELEHLERLDLSWNDLGGAPPSELGRLSELRALNLRGNSLSGSIPKELGELGRLELLDLSWNRLSGALPSEIGRLPELQALDLRGNNLSGSIPGKLGELGRLEWLDLSSNALGGALPSGLGKLSGLRGLFLSGNRLSGSIPGELGDLGRLERLDLSWNQLSGEIPVQFGGLTTLVSANLVSNRLSGPLPAELGRAASLEELDLSSNALAGPVPPEFGNLTLLRSLILADNLDMAGPLPHSITKLDRLEVFVAGRTGLCRPLNDDFDTWFHAIARGSAARCEGGTGAYLTQTVQSWDDPVPLLAGESALLRVFVTAEQGDAAPMPDVRATFYVDGIERHSVQIPEGNQSIPSEVLEGHLARSGNAEIPGRVVLPGLEMVIEVDPEDKLDPALGVTKRIPASGRMAVDVRPVPAFNLTLVPFLLDSDPDLSVVETVSAMAADPEGHELLRDVRTLLPIAELAVVAHQPVMTSNIHSFNILRQVDAMRLMEGGAGHWMGMQDGRSWGVKGVAQLGGYASVADRDATTLGHELGHNLSLRHAPCGRPGSVDRWFPHVNGTTGAWGYDSEQDTLVTPQAYDIMSYCAYRGYWISDFFFNQALDHRLATADAQTVAAETLPSTQTLLLWGGRGEDGVPYLDPALVVHAVPSLPDAAGEYTIEGATVGGTPLFSFTFDMPVVGDAVGEQTSFVFALPVEPGWADELASITLSGPDGSDTLDETTDRPMAILRDPLTGQVRGFVSDLPPGSLAETAFDAAGAITGGPRIEVLFSRGIPEVSAWRR